jgi:hypothetical protein
VATYVVAVALLFACFSRMPFCSNVIHTRNKAYYKYCINHTKYWHNQVRHLRLRTVLLSLIRERNVSRITRAGSPVARQLGYSTNMAHSTLTQHKLAIAGQWLDNVRNAQCKSSSAVGSGRHQLYICALRRLPHVPSRESIAENPYHDSSSLTLLACQLP